ncbi:tripartite tricarboxylate transporter TctB family protein [Sporosarcina sp. ACRSL]|uniref:tripartite tricarboxylate transporter TctB family protein n=1 Tax=Sporosarcina sp. ACRSL TaxID=2918215 RepID=UPI001EF63B0C|nr:tripartite tricarboxylate transporter TctB family protein [Sporosarcina sp. ACRSL]MCG7345525.1 tripartite tricarboxylate transporter TctB family protein [Sporosarcina sp. ACRSL]
MTLANRIIGIGLLLFSIYVWLTANAFPPSNSIGPGADFFPKVTATILGILSVLLVFKKEENAGDIFTLQRGSIPHFIGGFISLIIYVILVPIIGFFISTVLVSLFWMLLMGIRRWVVLVSVSILLSVVVVILFEYVMNVPIPHGVLY